MLSVVRFALLLSTMVAARALGGGITLPAIDGELSGQFTPTAVPGAPTLTWKVVASRIDDRTRHVIATAEGEGARFRAEADYDLVTNRGTWRITEGLLDAKRWIGPAVDGLGGTPGWEALGVVSVGGNGVLGETGPSGCVQVAWRDGTLSAPKEGWSLEGITITAEFAFDDPEGPYRSGEPMSVAVRTITTTRFGARNLAILAALQPDQTVAVRSARVEVAGGEATVAPFVVSLRPLEAEFDLSVTRVGLQDVAALVPSALSEARGRVDGNVRLRWTGANGLKLGAGNIVLRNDEPAEVRLAPTPGLITNSLPDAKRELVLKYYPGLAKIEMGQLPIRAELLEVSFTPDGDGEGRTAAIHLAGGPVDPNMKAPVDLVVNVRGPLEPLIKLGTSSRLHFGNP